MKTKKWLKRSCIVGIYRIVSPTGRVYIGQSWSIKNRWRMHKRINFDSKKSILKDSLIKYGVEKHNFEIIHQLPQDVSQDILDAYEIAYISMYRTSGLNMMNILDGGGNTKWSQERKEKHLQRLISSQREMVIKRKEKGIVPWNKGTKGVVKAWNKGLYGVVKASEETKNKISIANKGKKNSLGRKMNKKTRDAIFAANKGRKHGIESKKKMAESKIGNNYGVSNKNKIRTEETKLAISRTLKSRTDNKGQSHNSSKLTESIVIEIRNKYIPRLYSLSKLAKEYNISKTNVLDIVNRKIWNYDHL